jgi:putative ABC transport system ATP-binding protein
VVLPVAAPVAAPVVAGVHAPVPAPVTAAPALPVPREPLKAAPAAKVVETVVLSGLSKRYGDAVVFENISLRVLRGEFVAVIGESGVGKSTLLNCMAGLDTWDSGRVVLGGQDLSRLDATRRALLRRTHVGFVFQAFHVLPHLDVAQNIALPLMLLRDAQQLSDQAAASLSTETGALNAARLGASMSALDAPSGGFWRRLFGGGAAKNGSGKWGKDERVRAMLAAVGLEGLGGRLPQQLSGGQLQRVAIARALIHRPALVLADEPTGNLDPDTAARVMDVLCEQAREHGTSVVLVTHSQASAARADRRCKLRTDGISEQLA